MVLKSLSERPLRLVIKIFALWVLGALVIVVPLSRFNLVRFYRLSQVGVKTSGVVTDLQPTNHESVYYSYEADGRAFNGVGRAGFGNPEFCCLKVGQPVIVYYLPNATQESCLGLPNELIKNEAPPIALAGIVFPLFALAVYASRIPRFKRWLLDNPETISAKS
jgi:hypothetical protein